MSILVIVAMVLLPKQTFSQSCNNIIAGYSSTESRCAASGIISIKASGGSGNYEYKVSGPVNTAYVPANIIAGLPPGKYLVSIHDITQNCTYAQDTVVVPGNYTVPVFSLAVTNASCMGTGDGTITVTNAQFGRAPYSFEIIAPSASGIGTVSTIGVFTGLFAGNYYIRLTDSCGTQVVQSAIIKSGTGNCCASLTGTYQTTESRCQATGTVLINATGGSGNYIYKVTGPVVTPFTSSNLITGLSAGRYLVTIRDIVTGCEYAQDSVTVTGNYQAPNFTMTETDVTCINGTDGTITVSSEQYGRAPFSYQIIAPSTSGIGTVSVPGVFTGLPPGNYFIQLSDSCGAIQTRNIAIQNYDWFINSYTVTRTTCDSVFVTIKLKDIKGKVTPDSVFNGFMYGASTTPGDTTWYSTNTFTYYVGNKTQVKLFVKDRCGNVKSVVWTGSNLIPSVSPVIAISDTTCTTFTATVTGQINLTNPTFCIYDIAGTQLQCNSTGVFTLLPYGTYNITIHNSCYDTTILRTVTGVRPIPSVGVSVQSSCNDFTVSITGQQNLLNPYYCLYDSTNTLIMCDSTGVFQNLPFGNYCIHVINDPSCYDTTIIRCFTAHRLIPSVDANVQISDLDCSTFTATITGQTNLFNPKFCLYTLPHNIITCNNTGIFTGLPYGSYCIDITGDSTCYDTTITRCFTVVPPKPSVGPAVIISDSTCNSFTATIGDTAHLHNPWFCIYAPPHILITCNSTGIFTGLPYGTYCIDVINDSTCYDTTITRCFTVHRPIPSVNAAVTISNKTCNSFTATVTGQTNLSNPSYCIYTAANILLGCNATGVFDNLKYGSYCIKIKNDSTCYDTTITRCFSVARPIPSVNASVSVSNKNCITFTATITGQTNLYNAQYCLYDAANVQLSCNTTGVFTTIPYGSYCIKIRNDSTCYDTTIKKCFTVAAPVASISLTAKKSCVTIGTSDIRVNINSGVAPFNIKLYSPAGVLLQNINTSSTSYTFTALPQLAAPLKYKIILMDQCGYMDSALVAPVISVANRVVTVTPKCPSGTWPTGSSNIEVDINNNNIGGNITPKIIKKNGVSVSISASLVVGYKYTFLDLGPATYIFDTYIEDCNKHLYDTVLVKPYIFPVLSGSNAYQCDNNGFTVNVSVNGGVGPFMYEIIGSIPSTPSIVTPPQPSPVFNINNGTVYSLIRLRVTDVCGNASLYDVSVLPLGNFLVFADTLECFGQSLTLHVDSVANAQYTWYKRVVPNDSIVVGTGTSLYFPSLSLSDTGRYFCKIVVSNGCLIRYANYVLTGFCGFVLPAEDIALTGQKQSGMHVLQWNTAIPDVKEWCLQRSDQSISNFKTIHTAVNIHSTQYSFADNGPAIGNNYYRVKVTSRDNKVRYSNVVLLKNSQFDITIYPNPVDQTLYVSLKNAGARNYLVEISNLVGQKVYTKVYSGIQDHVQEIHRPAGMNSGVYVLTITDLQTQEKESYKILYK
ncbi:MAG: T9SS type A sorting domain-containing protein [Bacteroidetes bacterium]|nr:T9SS type A sorting domain-containing protein [Bacteroidota bacterium]